MRFSRPWLVRVLVGLIALASLVFAIHSGNNLRFADEILYWSYGTSLREGKGYLTPAGIPSTARPPGYPVVLAAGQLIIPQPITAKLLNVAFAVALSLVIARLARRIHDSPNTTPIALLFILCFPILHFTSGTLYPQVFGTLLFVVLIDLITRGSLPPIQAFFAGMVFGWLLLAIPAFLLQLPLIMGFLIWPFRGQNWSQSLRAKLPHIALFLIATSLMLSPWILRNARVFHKFIPLSTNSGLMLICGNSENATPNSGASTDISKYLQIASQNRWNEIQTDAYFKDVALEWIRAHPAQAVRLYFLKVLNHFNYRNELATVSESSRTRDLVSFATYYPILILALIRLAFCKRFPVNRVECLIYVLYFSNAFLSSIFFPRIRYRMPFDLLLIAPVAAFVAWRIAQGSHATSPKLPHTELPA